MPNIGPLEIAIVLIIALLVFGPKRLPDLGRSLGRGINEFKDGLSSIGDDPDDEEDEDLDEETLDEEAADDSPAELVSGETVDEVLPGSEPEVTEVTAAGSEGTDGDAASEPKS